MVKPRASWLAAMLAFLGLAAQAAPQVWVEPVTGMEFIALSKGCFQMGTRETVKPLDDLAWKQLEYRGNLAADERPQHEACVNAFLIGRHEVRAADWQRVMGIAPPQGKDAEPASGISWQAAQEFAALLTQQSGGKYRFRLPTEAEWEYACRAGAKKESIPGRTERIDVAWYSINESRVPQPNETGRRKPNVWGLHDMLGNVWEWVEDAYRVDGYTTHSLYNPVVKDAPGGERVLRGASHRSEYLQVRCGNRASYAADDALGQFGLRLVRTR